VIHLGSHLGKGIDKGIENICNAVNSALESTENVTILLENGAGSPNGVGSKFSEIGKIVDTIGSDRVGICVDTCHMFAAGYDMRDGRSAEKTASEFSNYINPNNLKLIHLNDSKYDLGQRLDRHQHIGKGHIGIEGFVSLFREKAFANRPLIMELPEDADGSHADDMKAALDIMEKAKG
jgi:deoxyribonuclease-4